jgi:hypothetical protein
MHDDTVQPGLGGREGEGRAVPERLGIRFGNSGSTHVPWILAEGKLWQKNDAGAGSMPGVWVDVTRHSPRR